MLHQEIRKLIHQAREHVAREYNSTQVLLNWMIGKTKGIDDALIPPYSGHENCASLEVYSKLSLSDAQESYDDDIKDFPI